MNQSNPVEKTVVKCMIVGSLSLATLAVAGCNEFLQTQVVEVASAEAANQAVDPLHLIGKIANNHNETFLSSAVECRGDGR